jgi:lysophospholipase L1-like esterase
VTIWFGSNDGAEERSEQHIPLVDYKANLIKIINKLRKIPRSSELPLLLVTPPATHGKNWEKVCLEEKGQDNQNRDSENISKYAQAVRELGAEYNIPVLDFWVEDGIVPDVEDQFIDGLHFSAKGNNIVAKLLIEKLEKEFGHLAIDNGKWKYPHYSTLYGK